MLRARGVEKNDDDSAPDDDPLSIVYGFNEAGGAKKRHSNGGLR